MTRYAHLVIGAVAAIALNLHKFGARRPPATRPFSAIVSHVLALGALAVVALVLGLAFMLGVGLAGSFELKAFAASVSAAAWILFVLALVKLGFELDALANSSADTAFDDGEARRYSVANDH